ncbi:MAG: glycoside hydrolase family 26 protein, partial [Thermoanaerobaculia bacterium]
IGQMGSVPLITWEPWVVDFDERLRKNRPSRAEREYASLRSIAKGDYDFYIVKWAKAAAEYRKPLFIRFAHEMNDPYRYPWGPQNGNRPDDFVAAWRHVHVVFQKMGATNVLWIWSPHISMPWFEYYYPGPEYVDWIGVGVLNYGTIASWSRWWSFHQILEKAYPTLLKLNKPIMISEFGTLGNGGDVPEWYRQAFYHMDHTYRSGVRAVIFFNQPADLTMPTLQLNWSVTQSPKATTLATDELARRSAP